MDLHKIDTYIQSGDLLRETVDQLEKDFLMIAVNFNIEKPVNSYKQLFEFTLHLVNALNERNPKKILNLMYRIDLPEEKVQKEMKKTELNFTEMLSEMIVKREIYKVILRKKYSS